LNRLCVKCNKEWPLDQDHYFRDAKSEGGFRRECKACRKSADKRPGRAGSKAPIMPAEPLEEVFPEPAPEPVPTVAQAQALEDYPVKPVQMTPDRPWKILLITDIHVPEHDHRTWNIILQLIWSEQPDEIIIMGDFAELAAFSMHGNGAIMEHWESEKAWVRYKLKELRHYGPNAVITYLEGNHETRVTRWCDKNAPQLRDELSLPRALELEGLGIGWVSERHQPIERGNLRILHGHQMGSGKSQSLPAHHAKRATERYGAPGKTIVYGHTHVHQTYEAKMYGGNARGVGLGCGRTLDVDWTNGVHGWVHQIAMAYVRPAGTVDLYPIDIQHGAAIWNGQWFVGSADGT
jgi:predicted phosphodiesterase